MDNLLRRVQTLSSLGPFLSTVSSQLGMMGRWLREAVVMTPPSLPLPTSKLEEEAEQRSDFVWVTGGSLHPEDQAKKGPGGASGSQLS